ncbi:hypothetical protein [Nocardioides sp. B-3]|uniref:hypothetical protein n=1 Tax=Nocardioides sp. B-3 TaxID=2895565 RepID=UPI00215346AD|nr:hypothetical protein [Nocardioides sp. B-3]UUZ60930.1 hypothetical protein LP418_09645 [Nocardioides sp. B-3]
MRLKTTLALGAAALVTTASLVAPTGPAANAAEDRANVSAFPAKQLTTLSGSVPTPVMVHGATLTRAQSAVTATGMKRVTSFRKIGVVVATGTASQIRSRPKPARRDLRRGQPGHRVLPGTPATSPPAATRRPRP